MTTRHYLYAGTCTGLIADDDLTLYMCPDDGLLVLDRDLHDDWHQRTRTTICRCPRHGEPVPQYWHCALHDRSSKARGPLLQPEADR